MDDTPVIGVSETDVSEEETARMHAEIRHYLTEIERANERMKKDQTEIERLKSRTRAILAELAQMRAA